MPGSADLYRLSATQKDEPDFRYTMGQAIEDGVLCDYDITVPALTAHHAYVCLADLLVKQAGRFRRVLAYCNSVAEAKRFRMVLRELGLAAWHINGKTPSKKREAVVAEFAGLLQKPVHVLVTVEILGEGINIPNADTCMFVEPRSSYRSIIQAIGRVLRHHAAKTLAHIVLPAVALPYSRSAFVSPSSFGHKATEGDQQLNAREVDSLRCQGSELPSWQVEHQRARNYIFDAAEDEVSRLKSPAAIRVAAPRNQEAGRSSSFNRRRDKERSNSSLDFEGARLERKHCCGNHGKSGRQFSQTAPIDLQEDIAHPEHCQNTCTSMGSSHQHQQTHTPQKELQSQHLKGLRQSPSDLAVDQGPKIQKTRATCAKQEKIFTLKASSRSPMFNQQFSIQLERFLATLMVADHRLFGGIAGYRIQVADCTLADAGAGMMERWMAEIYSRLSAILSSEDQWETHFSDLEAFVGKHGRLPRRECEPHYERGLGAWLNGQCAAFREQRLPLHRFQKLLASSPLIRRRAKGWQTGDTDGLFRESCNQLREYVQLHHRLPDFASHQIGSSSWKLAKWVANLQGGNIRLDAGKMKMLQEVHPLVKAKLQKWQNAPRLRLAQWDRKFGQLSAFVLERGRLPTSRGDQQVERSCYTWLGVQCRRLQAGYLPDDLAQQLRNADPLIAAYIDASA